MGNERGADRFEIIDQACRGFRMGEDHARIACRCQLQGRWRKASRIQGAGPLASITSHIVRPR